MDNFEKKVSLMFPRDIDDLQQYTTDEFGPYRKNYNNAWVDNFIEKYIINASKIHRNFYQVKQLIAKVFHLMCITSQCVHNQCFLYVHSNIIC